MMVRLFKYDPIWNVRFLAFLAYYVVTSGASAEQLVTSKPQQDSWSATVAPKYAPTVSALPPASNVKIKQKKIVKTPTVVQDRVTKKQIDHGLQEGEQKLETKPEVAATHNSDVSTEEAPIVGPPANVGDEKGKQAPLAVPGLAEASSSQIEAQSGILDTALSDKSPVKALANVQVAPDKVSDGSAKTTAQPVNSVTPEDRQSTQNNPISSTPEPSMQKQVKSYCANITNAAMDARLLFQRKKLDSLRADIEKRTILLEGKIIEFKEWLNRRDEFASKARDSLVSIYASMKAEAAAKQLSELDEEAASSVLAKLDARQSSTIMGEMEPKKAARLMEIIAGSSKVPQVTQEPSTLQTSSISEQVEPNAAPQNLDGLVSRPVDAEQK